MCTIHIENFCLGFLNFNFLNNCTAQNFLHKYFNVLKIETTNCETWLIYNSQITSSISKNKTVNQIYLKKKYRLNVPNVFDTAIKFVNKRISIFNSISIGTIHYLIKFSSSDYKKSTKKNYPTNKLAIILNIIML